MASTESVALGPRRVNWFNIVYSEMKSNEPGRPAKRKYVLRERADQVAQTRARIVESTVALHQKVGPASTQISEVARKAGVQRATIYKHFPDDSSLFAACSAHWRSLHPAPDVQRWSSIAAPDERVRAALRDLYRWYRETEAMTGNVLRDAQTLPALRRVLEGGLLRYLATVSEYLAGAFDASGMRQQRISRAAMAAVDFNFWHALMPLGDEQAAALGAGLVQLAATDDFGEIGASNQA